MRVHAFAIIMIDVIIELHFAILVPSLGISQSCHFCLEQTSPARRETELESARTFSAPRDYST